MTPTLKSVICRLDVIRVLLLQVLMTRYYDWLDGFILGTLVSADEKMKWVQKRNKNEKSVNLF